MWSSLVPLIVGTVIVFPLAAYALSRRRVRGAGWYGILLLAIGWWSIGYAWELAASGLAVKQLALKVKYLGVIMVPLAWVGFTLSFVHIEASVVRRTTRAMWGVGAGLLVFAWTDGWHGLFWGPMSVDDLGGVTVLRGRGPGFWVNIVYTYAAMTAGVGVLILQAAREPYLYRKRALIIVSAAVLPWIGNLAYVVLEGGASLVDPTPLLFSCTGVLAAVAVFRYGILDPIPTLHDLRIAVMGDGVIVLDADGRIADLNRAAEAILRRSRPDVTGTRFIDVLPGAPVGALGDDRRDVTVERGGTTAVYDLQSSAVGAPGGPLTGAVVVLRDVTARRHAERALRDSERRYRDLVEHADDLILTLNLDGVVTAVNRACYTITGYPPEDVVGRHVLDFVASDDRPRAGRLLRMASQSSRTREDLRVPARDGRLLSLEVSGWLQFRNGRPVAIQAIARDVTIRRQLEAQLRQSQKMEAVGQLAGGVAHDFNNLMTTIIGFATLALEDLTPGSPARPRLEEILKSGEQAAGVTRQLLAFGRRQIMQPVVLQVNDVIEATRQVLHRLIGEDVALQTLLAPDLLPVKADVVQVQQVLLNLVVNARDAMPLGGAITIRSENVRLPAGRIDAPADLPAGWYVVVSVRDTGAGMDPSVMAHVFEPFFTTKEHGQGTGLGLSTVYGIIKQSGGDVTVASEPGRGATFTVYLPAAERTHLVPVVRGRA